MSQHPTETREAQAAREAGHTDVRPRLAWAIALVFLLLVGAVPSAEILRDARRGSGSPWPELKAGAIAARQTARASGLLAGNRRLLAGMTAFESALEDRSVVAGRALSGFQWFLSRVLRTGNEQVVLGRRGWLYYRPALDSLTGPGFLEPSALARRSKGSRSWEAPPQPDPLPALADFAAQLAGRGIGLVLVPVPVKAALQPEGLASSLSSAVPLQNPSFEAFLSHLADLGIAVYSPAGRLAEQRGRQAEPLFLHTDTHWTPRAMEGAAAGLATFLSRHVALPEREPVAFTRQPVRAGTRGDLAALLRLPAGRPLYRAESVLTQRVLGPDGAPWTPDPAADILVLGDSFTNIYSQAELGWGQGAGFAEQLAYFLQRPVDRIAVNAGGPAAARERLAAAIAGGDDRLAGKRLVVYEFSVRELSSGDWRLVELPTRPAAGQAGDRARTRRPEDPLPARGLLTWESNRSGEWRIWARRLEGSAPRQLTPDEPGRQHCCAHISPDGSQLVYLSRTGPADEYLDVEIAGELRLLRLADGATRGLVAARAYATGNRAAVWRSDEELVYIGADGRTRLLNVASGRTRPLTDEPRGVHAWLLDASLRHAVDGWPTFSAYDPRTRQIEPGRRRPGCEPYFTHDGRLGFWVAGAGGPIRWIELASGRTGTLLAHEDPRIPGTQRYAYFPMLSSDNRLLAFGASPGDHDHFRSNYDVFVAPVDPRSLELLGRPLRLTAHPASDRYPDVHVEALDVERWRRDAPPVPLGAGAESVRPAVAERPFTVNAVLRACSRSPSLREIAPYRSALVVCEWDVRQVLAGEAPSARIRVAHWALKDGARQPITTATPGMAIRLEVEPLVGTSQIEGYPVFDSLQPAPGLAVHYSRKP